MLVQHGLQKNGTFVKILEKCGNVIFEIATSAKAEKLYLEDAEFEFSHIETHDEE